MTALCALALGLAACGGGGSAPTEPVSPAPQRLGDPIEGLTAAELAAFERGRLVFERRFKPSEGLGPFYNATSCASCHSTPVPGGSARLYRNFLMAVWGPPGLQDPIAPGLGPVVPSYGTGSSHPTATFALDGPRSVIPATFGGWPVVTAQRNTIPMFGTGLFEFVSDATIVSNSDPNDDDGDGISGRYNTDAGAIGRFGVKAQSNNIERFTRGPLQNQMGVTSDPFLGSDGTVGKATPGGVQHQVSADPDDPTQDGDGVPDPEISRDDLGDLIAFSRFLAPPRQQPFDAAAQRGGALFRQIGCAKCHIPSLPSSRGPVEAYTDLLLHDMGPALADGISFGVAQAAVGMQSTTENEFRTQPLWGVSMHAPFLHDGRAKTLHEAIEMHAGEAEGVKNTYLVLTQAQRDDIVHFLEML